jgi:hypothetical protein
VIIECIQVLAAQPVASKMASVHRMMPMAWDAKEPILRTPEMALRLAELLFDETQHAMKLEWFSPLKVEDRDDMWRVRGKIDPNFKLPPDVLDDQLENQIFETFVVKADAEVINPGITAAIKMSPELKAQIRAELEAQRGKPLTIFSEKPDKNGYLLDFYKWIDGGIINSPKAANRFGAIIFENHFDLSTERFSKMQAEEVDGLWHVYGQASGRSAELVFRRSNAQVISLDLRPVE